jgi:hypothetical protein
VLANVTLAGLAALFLRPHHGAHGSARARRTPTTEAAGVGSALTVR